MDRAMKKVPKAQAIQKRQTKDEPTTEKERDWARNALNAAEDAQAAYYKAKQEGGTRRRRRGTRSTRRR